MPERKLGLDDAYAVQTPADNRALYRDWADTYETEFIQAWGYVYDKGVATLFARHCRAAGIGDDAPILDVGCGTGIVGVALAAHGFTTIDGFDLSPEMLAEAARKQTYRSLTEIDVTKPIATPDGTYKGVVSVGTFTHGHLGPEPLRELARIAAPGALFVIGVNAEHFASSGFAALFQDLCAAGTVSEPIFESTPIYAAAPADDPHAHDDALVAVYRKL